MSSVRRYLVVANQTLGGQHLAEKVRACLVAGPSRFHILVPATQPGNQAVWTEGEARTIAQRRLDLALERFREMGAEAEGDVGDEQPLLAIQDAVRDSGPFDEVILSTLPPGLSRWLRQDFPHRVERALDLPVTHIVGEAESAEGVETE